VLAIILLDWASLNIKITLRTVLTTLIKDHPDMVLWAAGPWLGKSFYHQKLKLGGDTGISPFEGPLH